MHCTKHEFASRGLLLDEVAAQLAYVYMASIIAIRGSRSACRFSDVVSDRIVLSMAEDHASEC